MGACMIHDSCLLAGGFCEMADVQPAGYCCGEAHSACRNSVAAPQAMQQSLVSSALGPDDQPVLPAGMHAWCLLYSGVHSCLCLQLLSVSAD